MATKKEGKNELEARKNNRKKILLIIGYREIKIPHLTVFRNPVFIIDDFNLRWLVIQIFLFTSYLIGIYFATDLPA